jgi:hypothetical protein
MHRARTRLACAAAVVLGFLAGCNKSSPSEPETANLAIIRLTITSPGGSSPLRSLGASLDGVAISVNGSGSPQYTFSPTTVPARGRHTFAIAVLDQTSSPSTYTASGVVELHYRLCDPCIVDDIVSSATLSAQTAAVSTGGGLTWLFDI